MLKIKKAGLKLPKYQVERAIASTGSMKTLQATQEHLAALRAKLAAKGAGRQAYI